MSLHLPDFSKARVLIVGDVMLDRYWSGSTSRISPEAPVPVVHIQQVEERPGGAGNVALNITALGSHASLLSYCGNDAVGDSLESKLRAAQVACHFERIADRSTITKLRVLSLHQQLIRLDFEDGFHTIDATALLANFKQQLPHSDVVILSDYAKGSLQCVTELITAARAAQVPVLIDPKGHDFGIYQGATLLTPNRKEFETIMGPCHSDEDFVVKGKVLLERFSIEALLVTRGDQGMTLIQRDGTLLHVPAQAREVYDVTGAGDTVIAVLAAVYALQRDFPLAVSVANLAAGIVVGKLGAATVSVAELRRAICEEVPHSRGVISEQQLLVAIEEAHVLGERIVMTGGCFDILHAGHVSYLQQARNLGDRLIVAVNDDASVTQLKGPTRPINSLKQRMAVLAGLSAVDWVVPFSEITPERIVSHLLPDIWVKGGDYQVADLPEAKPVLANGGEVKILPFVEGCSTSAVVKKIQG